jgi:hypothetical protein
MYNEKVISLEAAHKKESGKSAKRMARTKNISFENLDLSEADHSISYTS